MDFYAIGGWGGFVILLPHSRLAIQENACKAIIQENACKVRERRGEGMARQKNG